MSKILGIDPGKNGAFFMITPDRMIAHAFPLIPGRMVLKQRRDKWGNRIKQQEKSLMDWTGTLALFNSVYAEADAVVIERVGGGIRSGGAFNFGECYGFLCCMVMTKGMPLHKVTATVWKREFGLSKDKDASRLLAARLLPSDDIRYDRKRDDGVAEAGLIAHYGKTILGL